MSKIFHKPEAAPPDGPEPLRYRPSRANSVEAGTTLVEFARDGEWVCGVVMEATRHRLTIAVNGLRAHRAYVQRQTGNWRHIPEIIGNRARRAARATTVDNWSKS